MPDPNQPVNPATPNAQQPANPPAPAPQPPVAPAAAPAAPPAPAIPAPVAPVAPAPVVPASTPIPAPAPAPAIAAVNLPAMPVAAEGILIPRITLVPAGTTQAPCLLPPPSAPAAVVINSTPIWAWMLVGLAVLAIIVFSIVYCCCNSRTTADLATISARVLSVKDDTSYSRKLPDLIEAQGEATRMEVRDQASKTRGAVSASEGRIRAEVRHAARHILARERQVQHIRVFTATAAR